MNLQLLNIIALLLFGAILLVLAVRYWLKRSAVVRGAGGAALEAADRLEAARQNLIQRVADLEETLIHRVSDLEQQLSLIGQTIQPISTAFQAVLIQELTHFHTPRMDKLLIKLGPPFSLTMEEEAELATALEERTRDMGDKITPSERDAAIMLPLIMKRVRAEAEAGLDTPSQVQLVALLPDAGESPEEGAAVATVTQE